MGFLPSSPRRRRRLILLLSLVAVAALIGGIFLFLPSQTPPNPTPVGNEGAAQVSAKTSHYVAPADRRAIDALFDKFVPAALGRRSADIAWSLSGPGLRSGSTLDQWRHGITPIPAYPPAGTTFHGWSALDATKTTIDYNLLVHPAPGHHLSPYEFQGQLVKVDGQWLVDGIYTTAIFAKPDNGPKEVGPSDFAAPASAPPSLGTHGALSRTWLATLIAIIVGLLVLIPVGIGITVLVKRRRWDRQARATGRTELQPLRPAARAEQPERDRTPVG